MTSSRLTREITTCINNTLAEVGDFTLATGSGPLVLAREEEADLHLTLVVASRGDSSSRTVNPIVGLRHHAVEERCQQLLAQRPDRYSVTLSRPLLALVPGTSTGWVATERNCADIAREVHDEVRAHAVEPFRAKMSLPGVLAGIDSGWGERTRLLFRRPVTLDLLGRHSEARAATDRIRDLAQGLDTPFGREASYFVEHFTAHTAAIGDA